jgi:ABC-type glycerol-3-phosphate transport system substrate-binding protein
LDTVYNPKKPYFNTKPGRRFFEIMEDCNCHESGSPDLFCRGGAGINFMIGSWIAVQNKIRDGIRVDELKIVPYRLGSKKICNIIVNNLHTHLHSSITVEEKQRTWKFLKMILSKDFQKDFCSMSGAISVRNDLKPEDYAWYNDEFSSFMPDKDDIIIYNDVFSRSMKAYFTALFEQFKFYNAEIDTIVRCMDAKIQ